MEKTDKKVEMYVCPTPGCGNYYGVPNMPDLIKEFTGIKSEDSGALEAKGHSRFRHSRAECPDCAARGLGRIVRVRTAVKISVPVLGPDAPDLPAPNPSAKLAGTAKAA